MEYNDKRGLSSFLLEIRLHRKDPLKERSTLMDSPKQRTLIDFFCTDTTREIHYVQANIHDAKVKS